MTSPHDPRTMMGFMTPGDQRVTLPARDWGAMKLALWRSQAAWEIAARAAAEMVERCAHTDGCVGKEIEAEPCLPGCPDREQRMSALVVLSAARMFAPINARRPANEPYSAPSREYFSDVMAALAVAQAKLEALGEPASPPPRMEAALSASAQLKEAT